MGTAAVGGRLDLTPCVRQPPPRSAARRAVSARAARLSARHLSATRASSRSRRARRYTSSSLEEASSAPAYQCICILSERPYHRFFGQCLQLLHAARLAGGPVALKLARMLIGFSAAPPGAILPLRSLLSAPQIPGSLQLPRERLRVPLAVGLPYFDVPLAPLLNRLDFDALLMLYSAMLSERRVMFVAQAIPTLTACVHAAVALLQPFEWQNIFIPVRRRERGGRGRH